MLIGNKLLHVTEIHHRLRHIARYGADELLYCLTNAVEYHEGRINLSTV